MAPEVRNITFRKVNISELASISKLRNPLDSDGENWLTWRQLMTTVFRLAQVDGIVEGEIQKPSPESEDYATWVFNDAYAQFLITDNIDQDQLVHVAQVKTSHEMWVALEDFYQPTSFLTAIETQRTLTNTRAEEGDDIEEHLKRLKNIWEFQKSLDGEGFCMPNVFFKVIVTSSLPPSWNTFTDLLWKREKKPFDDKKGARPQEFMGAIREEYLRRIHQGDESKGRGHLLSKRMRSKTTTRCRICGYTNHKEKECRRRLHARKTITL